MITTGSVDGTGYYTSIIIIVLQDFLEDRRFEVWSGGGFGPLQAVLRGDETWHGLREGSQTSRSEHALRIP